MKKLLFTLLLLPFIAPAQLITTVAGGGAASPGDGVAATAAAVPGPNNLAYDRYGNMYLTDLMQNRVRRVSAAGIISTVAGPGMAATLGDGGPATAAFVNAPLGITCDTAGNVYFADRYNYRIRKINVATGTIGTVAGNGSTTFAGTGDGGAATAATFNTVADVLFDKVGNMYIADNSASVIRKVSPAGIITHFAGTGGLAGHTGDGGPASAAQLKDPRNMTIDDTGNIYVAEQLGRYIRKIDPAGIITTIAGTGLWTHNGDTMPATAANMVPTGITFFHNRLFFSTTDHRVRMLNLENDTVYTIAGTGTSGYNGDGIPSVTARLYNPMGVAVHDCGNVYVADGGNGRVRRIEQPPLLKVPTITLTGEHGVYPGHVVTINAIVANAGSSYVIHWLSSGVEFTTTTVPVVTFVRTEGMISISARIVPDGPCYDSATSDFHELYSESVDGVNAGTSIAIYPNPAHDQLYINGARIYTADILDLTGRVLLSCLHNATEARLNVAELPAGVYMVRVNGLVCGKFLKQ